MPGNSDTSLESRGKLPPDGNTIDDRIDSMPRAGLGKGAALTLLACYFFANYDISVWAVSLQQMKADLQLSSVELTLPVTWNLIGYCIGGYWIGNFADRWGRQRGLALTVVVLTVGGFLTAISWNGLSLTVFRFIAGCGMGAVLAVASTYIGEVAPKDQRGLVLAKIYTAQAVLLVVIGFASLPILSAFPQSGWRLLMAFGGLVVLVLPLLNDRTLGESPRWLHSVGRNEQAAQMLSRMEQQAWGPEKAATLGPPTITEVEAEEKVPVSLLLRRPLVGRMSAILGFWFLYYIVAYGFLGFTPLLLEALDLSAGDALLITVLGRVSAVAVPLLMLVLVERIERRTLTLIGALITAGGLFLLLLPIGPAAATLGALAVNFGNAFVVIPGYIYTAELFPTRVRGTAAAVADGVGHLGGAVAPLVVIPLLGGPGGVATVLVLGSIGVLSAACVRMGVRTRSRGLEDIAA